MKKFFKFFMAAAIVAAGFTACSDEEVTPGPGPGPNVGPNVEGEPTYATFNFQLDNGLQSKAVTPDDLQEPSEGESTFSSIRLIIFDNKSDNSGLLEVDTLIAGNDFSSSGTSRPNQSATVLVKSGSKRLFVIANSANGTTGQSATSKNFDTQLKSMTIGSTKYSDFLTTYNPYDFGTTQVSFPTLPTAAPTAITIDPLVKTSTANSSMVYANTTADSSSVKFLKAGVGEQASREATGTVDQKAEQNHFVIYVKRPVAKAIVYYTGNSSATPLQAATLDGKGTLDNLKYNFRNLNRAVNLFQTLVDNSVRPRAPYYTAVGQADLNNNDAYKPFYYRPNALTTFEEMGFGTSGAPTTLPSNKPYYYITENDLSLQSDGGRTHAAVAARYTPTDLKVVTTITGFDATFHFTGVETDNYTAGNHFWRIKVGVGSAADLQIAADKRTNSIPAGILFNDSVTAKKVLYVAWKGNLTGFNGSTYYPELSENLQWYKNGICYYRINLRQPNPTTGIDEGINKHEYVLRNTAYKVAIKSFSMIGAPDIEELDDNPGRQEAGDTYVTAEIYVIPWDNVYAETPVDPYDQM